MSNIDLLMEKLKKHEYSLQDSERRAKELIFQAVRRAEMFVERVEDALKQPASHKLLTLTRTTFEQDTLVEGKTRTIELTGLKVAIPGREDIVLKPMVQPWEGQIPVRFFLKGARDDNRSIVQGDEDWEISSPLPGKPVSRLDKEGIAGLFVELL